MITTAIGQLPPARRRERQTRGTGAALVVLLMTAACSSTTTSSGSATSTSGSVQGSAAANAASVSACAATPAAAPTADAAPATLSATKAFLATLDTTQKSTVQADRSQANLSQWSNLPDQLFKRAGLRMDTLSTAQQAAAMKVLQAALSPEGYTQVTQISTADGVLAATAQMDLDFGADHYWIRILGTPATTGPWTVQYGGHHLAVNVTVVGDRMTLAPTLWGAQPSSYTAAGTSAEPLCGETTKAFALMDALDPTQQQQATLGTAVKEIVLGAGQDGKTLAQEGAKASTFTADQKKLLLDLIDEWIRPLNPQQAAAKLTDAQAHLDQTTFAWYGSTTIGNPIYYRVQSPTFVIEFAHQQGGGANAGGITHIHSIYREIGDDYGAALSS